MSLEPLKIQAKFAPPMVFSDFDKKQLRKGFTRIGKEVSKIAKKLAGTPGVSKPGQYPGKQSGILQKSLTYKVSRSGFSVGIKPYVKGAVKKTKVADVIAKRGFYPAFVIYGHAAPKKSKRDKRHARQPPAGKVAKPRANPAVEAAKSFGQSRFQAEVSKILESAFKPGPIRSLLK